MKKIINATTNFYELFQWLVSSVLKICILNLIFFFFPQDFISPWLMGRTLIIRILFFI